MIFKEIKSGSKYNRWTVQSTPFKKGRFYYVNVTCECGINRDVLKRNILNGKSISCGCFRNEVSKTKGKKHKKIKPIEEISRNALFLSYKYSAAKRGYKFSILKEKFEYLIEQPCEYCATIGSNIFSPPKRKETYSYNGIDRINNDIGYEDGNIITCCKTCNMMKNTLGIENFFEHIQRVIKNTKVKPGIKEHKLESYYQRALTISLNSPDEQTKVGALLINNDSGAVIAEGFNGFVRGAPDSLLPKTRPKKYEYIIHAEENLLCNAARHGISTDNCVIFCTLSPCKSCIRMLWQAGIKVIYFKDTYSDLDYSQEMGDINFKIEKIENFNKLIFL